MITEITSTPFRILICDDSNTERLAMARCLRGDGYAVDEANDGQAAIDHVKKRSCDLILLDLTMPGSDGFAVLRYLQEHHRALPVLLMSGMAPNKIQRKIHTLPAHELPPLLVKPVDPQQLLGLVNLVRSGELPTRSECDDTSNGEP